MPIDGPTHHQFFYESDGTKFTITARGDLDCDGTMEDWIVEGTADNGAVHSTLRVPR